jgi:hypothetical protein
MTKSISDPEVRALAMISATLQVEHAVEDLVAGWLAAKDFDVARSPDSSADRLVNGHRVEIKFSTLWKSGIYKFQQLRDQSYSFAICLGVSPFDAHCWVIPKGELVARWQESIRVGQGVGGIQPQHGGVAGRDTAWLTVKPSDPPAWLTKHGGGLAEAAAFLGKNARRRPP